MKILTYNIQHGRGTDGSVSLERIAGVIGHTGADLVALQEVDRRRRRFGLTHQARRLGRLLDMRYEFCGTIGWWIFGFYGNAILSRYPISFRRCHSLPGPGEPRGLVTAGIRIGDGEVHFLCVHLGLSAEARRQQIAHLLTVAGDFDGPLILAGDFNCRPDAPELAPVLRTLTDTSTNPEGDLTFPSINPTARIDYVFVSPHWRSLASGTVDTQASDHLPYYAKITRCQ